MSVSQSCADNCNEFVSVLLGKSFRWRRNGKTQRWKRTPLRYKVPVKHGLYNYAYVEETTDHVFCMTHDDEASSD